MEMELGSDGLYGDDSGGVHSDSAYPLQYYFELRAKAGEAWLYPAFNATLSNQPYLRVDESETSETLPGPHSGRAALCVD